MMKNQVYPWPLLSAASPVFSVIPVLILSIILTGCDVTDTGSEEVPKADRQLSRELSVHEQMVTEGSNDFAFRLLHILHEKEGDQSFFVSPLSISTAFGMALNGAETETYEQMRDFFGFEGMTLEEINQAKRDLIGLLSGLDPQVVMNIANSVWYREGFEVKEDFLERNRVYFDAEVRELDFSDPRAPDIINGWIEEKTEGLIEEMIDEIGHLVVMYLINAIYFKGDWTMQFDPEKTQEAPFHLPGGGTTEVPLMQARAEFRHYFGDDWTALDMWYGEAGFSFTALLPAGGATLNDRVPDLTFDRFEAITSSLESDTIHIHVPKFELEYEIEDFPEELIGMGLILPFGSMVGERADFSGITEEEYVEVSDVMHRAVIKLDEKGSEAAAVTVIEISRESGPRGIRLDRPFLFFIRENTSNTILFMGAYTGVEG